MNDFYYEVRGREKAQEFRQEALTRQELQRSGARYGLIRRLPHLAAFAILALGLLVLILR
jgi:hypothetical protein